MNESTAVVLDFEKDILEIEEKIEHLKLLAKDEDMDITREIRRLERKLSQHVNRTYMNLSAWRRRRLPDIPQDHTVWII